MDKEKTHQLSLFQEISKKMLGMAESKDWEKLPDLENERKILMQFFFEQSVSAQDSAQVKQVIQDVLSINEKISQLAEQEKMLIGQQINSMKKRQNVHSAYLENK